MSLISFSNIQDGTSIHLSDGTYALIDSSDYGMLSKYSWVHAKYKTNEYAHTTIRINGKRTTVKMHRMILNAPKGLEVDHINSNGLDNCRINLRLCTRTQNQANSRVKSNSVSKFKGIYKRTDTKCDTWRAHIRRNGERIILGPFKTLRDAIVARNDYIKKIDGDFARLEII